MGRKESENNVEQEFESIERVVIPSREIIDEMFGIDNNDDENFILAQKESANVLKNLYDIKEVAATAFVDQEFSVTGPGLRIEVFRPVGKGNITSDSADRANRALINTKHALAGILNVYHSIVNSPDGRFEEAETKARERWINDPSVNMVILYEFQRPQTI